jgi:hypothetical protein
MIPYAPDRPGYNPGTRISDIILRQGENAADAAHRSGQIWGGAVQGLGRTAAGAVEEYGARKAEARQAEDLSRRDQAAIAVMSNPDADPLEFVKIYGPREGIKIAEGFAAFKKIGQGSQSPEDLVKLYGGLNAVSPKLRAQAYPTIVQNISKAIPGLAGALPQEYSDEGWKEIGAMLGGMNPPKPGEGFTLGTGQVRFGPNGEQIAAGPVEAPKPEAPPQPRVVGRSLVGPDGKVIYRDPESSSPKTENKIWVMRPGQDGKMQTVFVSESQVQPGDQPANTRSGEGRPSLGGEKAALGFFNRAKQADEELKTLTAQISGKGLGGQAWMALAPNFLQTQEGQAYQQAQRAFTEARLRKDSGAAIPETEFANDRKTYFAQPGDSAETAAQKERGRAAVLASLAFQAGRALNEFYGEDAEPLLEGYKARQAPSAGQAKPPDGTKSGPGASKGKIVQLPDGTYERR